MACLIIELTNRCNLRCVHCFDERHAATGELPIELLEKVLSEGRDCGIDHITFTGGEPTLHPRFRDIVRRVSEAKYPFSFVSNGATFPKIYPLLLEHRQFFKGVTFSLEGALEATHDRLRGKGSYRHVMRAASLCVFKDLFFTFNMVLMAPNRAEVETMVGLATKSGSAGVRFGYLMLTPDSRARGLDLGPAERLKVEAEIRHLQQDASIHVRLGPGYFSAAPMFSCAPLGGREYNLDYQGNLSLCCQLSGYTGAKHHTDFVGNLNESSLKDAISFFHQRVAQYLEDKRERVRQGSLTQLDHFPCFYCAKVTNKLSWLDEQSSHPWAAVNSPVELGGEQCEH